MTTLSFIEDSINHYLECDTEAQEHLTSLEKKTIALELTNTKTVLFVSIVQNKIRLSTDLTTQANVTLRGTPLSMMNLLLQKNKTIPQHIHIEGEIHVAQQLQRISSEFQMDWTSYLAEWIGDIPAYHIGKIVRGIKSFGSAIKTSLESNAVDYVQHEKNLLPTQTDIHAFCKQVDDLHIATERLAAHIQHYKTQGAL